MKDKGIKTVYIFEKDIPKVTVKEKEDFQPIDSYSPTLKNQLSRIKNSILGKEEKKK